MSEQPGVVPGVGPEHARPRRPRTRRWIARAVACLLVIAGAAWVLWAQDEAPSQGSTGGAVIQQYEQEDRQAVEEFTGVLLNGARFESADMAGKVAVYNVWGSWCVPCRREAPELIDVAEEYEDRVRFVGVNVRDSVAAARAFERRMQVPYPSLRSSSSGDAFLAFGGALTATAVPTTVVVDAEGRVAARVVGPTTATTLSDLVEDALPAPAGRNQG